MDLTSRVQIKTKPINEDLNTTRQQGPHLPPPSWDPSQRMITDIRSIDNRYSSLDNIHDNRGMSMPKIKT